MLLYLHSSLNFLGSNAYFSVAPVVGQLNLLVLLCKVPLPRIISATSIHCLLSLWDKAWYPAFYVSTEIVVVNLGLWLSWAYQMFDFQFDRIKAKSCDLYLPIWFELCESESWQGVIFRHLGNIYPNIY